MRLCVLMSCQTMQGIEVSWSVKLGWPNLCAKFPRHWETALFRSWSTTDTIQCEVDGSIHQRFSIQYCIAPECQPPNSWLYFFCLHAATGHCVPWRDAAERDICGDKEWQIYPANCCAGCHSHLSVLYRGLHVLPRRLSDGSGQSGCCWQRYVWNMLWDFSTFGVGKLFVIIRD